VARFFELVGSEGEESLWQVVANLRRAAAAREMADIFEAASAVGDKESKEGLPEALALLARFYRDSLAAASGADDLILLRERAGDLQRLASAQRHPQLGLLRRALAGVLEADAALAANANAVLAVERMLLEMRPCERGAAA
jgi:hypothetical protein